MKHFSFIVDDATSMDLVMESPELAYEARQSSAILVQVYSAMNGETWYQSLAENILKKLPAAVIVGTSTFGEIAEGHTLTGQTVIGFTFFHSTSVTSISLPCTNNNEVSVGEQLRQTISNLDQPVSGVLLLATPLSINVADFLQGFQSDKSNYPVFGGGAGDYAAMSISLVSSGTTCYSSGVVAVVFSGPDLHIESGTYLGWRMISKEMTVTDVDDMVVKTVDGKPAFEVYAHYLGIPNDSNFFLSALEFPFMFKRNNEILARVPFGAKANGGIQFVADIQKGETFRMGYGDPEMIIKDSKNFKQAMREFEPEVVFLYSCCCRRFLMQNDVELETLPFESIAPTFGFYTYGEFHGTGSNIKLMNSTLVAVGFREGPGQHAHNTAADKRSTNEISDSNLQSEGKVIPRLVHFLGAITVELEQANRELLHLSSTDSLTQINNRGSLDHLLNKELARASRYATVFSIILLDIDFFKQVNDTHGHASGDMLLEHLAKILKENIRESDSLGRWGGDEFLIILPETGQADAFRVAEKLRQSISLTDFPEIGHISSSFGVTSCRPKDNEKTILSRADEALYAAKNSGRNQVCRK